MDGIGHGIDVPIVGLDHIVENFCTSRLLGDDRRHTHLHGFERRDAERLGNRGHDIDIAGLEHLIDLPAFLETGEVEAVGDAALGGESDHFVHHVARTSHHETDIAVVLKHLGSSLDKILRAFLHGNAAEEGHHLLLGFAHFDVKQLLTERHYGVVNCRHFCGIDAITLDDRLTGQIADRDDMVGVDHAVALDVEHSRVDIAARAVIVCRVDMDHQRLAGDLLGVDAGGIGQPVVAVDYVAVDGACDHSGRDRIIVDLFKKIVGIATRELYAAEIVGAHIVEIGIYMVAQTKV